MDPYGQLHPRAINESGPPTDSSPVPSVNAQLQLLQESRRATTPPAPQTPGDVEALPADEALFMQQCEMRSVLPLLGVYRRLKANPEHLDLNKLQLGDRLLEVRCSRCCSSRSTVLAGAGDAHSSGTGRAAVQGPAGLVETSSVNTAG